MNYEKLGLKMGLEIHQQLNTDEKLFCACSCNLTDKKPEFKILRNLRPTQSELGKIDRAAFEEARRKLNFIYESYTHETCLVEADEEPPNPLNLEALEISLILATLLSMHVVDEFHMMRKQVIDGSNTGGFQRTGLVATEGYLETEYGKVIIENLCLEEDAARRIGQEKGKVTFRLDRLGIPLVEITTDPSMKHPEQVKDVAYQIGQILRSTKVKRGLGTIRQDLNISIREGARVEIKGVQDLDLMPTMVDNEVTRQINLLKIRDELIKRNASVDDELYDVVEVLSETRSKIIAKAEAVFAIKLKGFKGLIGMEIQPGRRFGTELAGYAKKMGVSGLFHTDELPAYGIVEHEVEALNKFLGLNEYDAFILIADNKEKVINALQEVQRRAKMALGGVPEETRKVTPEGNTEYLRPLPTASRMYVETDIPAISILKEQLEDISNNLPELPEEKKERIKLQYNLSEDLATQLVRTYNVESFEIIEKETNSDSTTLASTLAYTLKELRRDGCDIDKLDNDTLIETFTLLVEGKISKDAITPILENICREDNSPEKAAKSLNLIMLSPEEVEEIIAEIVDSNNKMVEERGMAAMGPLMGMAMKQLKGKADGKLVNKLLKDKIQNIIS
ncbi:Glu-tRNA(Gln) amidotransferase subunit GatE [Methanobacterium oryzae]|uniref:Glu-tRNA(Gln) amidotransferase subunit GatE n=1 Tax=Methanobacterium oryzae TaxID=69540 RepID=UPI003D260C7A